jgi:hypothetical protein
VAGDVGKMVTIATGPALAYTAMPTSLPPSGAASGSLTGSYPGPTIAASAVRGTPSAGGTAREIAKASIWAADDLIDVSIPTAKLAALAVTDAKINDLAATKLTGTIVAARLPSAPSGIVTANVNDGAITQGKLAKDASRYAWWSATSVSSAIPLSLGVSVLCLDVDVSGLLDAGRPLIQFYEMLLYFENQSAAAISGGVYVQVNRDGTAGAWNGTNVVTKAFNFKLAPATGIPLIVSISHFDLPSPAWSRLKMAALWAGGSPLVAQCEANGAIANVLQLS